MKCAVKGTRGSVAAASRFRSRCSVRIAVSMYIFEMGCRNSSAKSATKHKSPGSVEALTTFARLSAGRQPAGLHPHQKTDS